jgi:hypothetical protein
MRLTAAGQVELICYNAGAANYRIITTYQSLPLNKKTHVAASWTGGTVVFYFDGVSVPVSAAVTSGTAPTTGATGGDFSIGRHGAFNGQYFAGYVSGVGVFDAVLTAATIKSYSSQVLSGSETNCIGAWSLNNVATDANAAANNLTATGGVSYTARSPYATDATGTPGGTYDFGIVTKVSTTTATIQVPEGCTIPTSGGVSAVDLSAYKSPFGFPAQRDRWNILLQLLSSVSTSGTSVNTTYNPGGLNLNVPVGNWNLTFESQVTVIPTATTPDLYSTLSTSSSAFTIGSRFNVRHYIAQQSGSGTHILSSTRSDDVSVSSATPYYILLRTTNAFSNITVRGDVTSGVGETTSIVATPAHL